MRILSAALLVTLASAFAFDPRRISREPSSFVIRINNGTNKRKIQSLQVATSDIANDRISSSPDLARKIKDGYKLISERNYLTLAFAQAGILASFADIATQMMENGNIPLDIAHVAAMATIASTMSGVFNAICLRHLEDGFPGRNKENVAIKTVFHATIIASIINSAYLAGVPLLANHIYHGTGLPDNPFGAWQMSEFITLTKLEVAMFIPYNTLAFAFVPPQVRPLTHAAISASFNVAVSAVTLGYFDTWCGKVMNVIG